MRLLHLDELTKIQMPVQETLMTKSEVIGYINKGELVLIVMSKEETEEEEHALLDPQS